MLPGRGAVLECKVVVAQYGQTFMGLLLLEASPHKICSLIGLCIFDGTRGVSMGIESVADEKNGDKLFVIHDVGCSTCEMAVVWMQSQIW